MFPFLSTFVLYTQKAQKLRILEKQGQYRFTGRLVSLSEARLSKQALPAAPESLCIVEMGGTYNPKNCMSDISFYNGHCISIDVPFGNEQTKDVSSNPFHPFVKVVQVICIMESLSEMIIICLTVLS